MNKQELEKLGGTISKIGVMYSRKVSDGSFGSIGGEFFVEADLAASADPDRAIDAIYAYVKEAATRNLKPSFDAVKPKGAPVSAPAPPEPIAPPPAPQPAPAAPEQAPLPVPAPAPSQAAPRAPERILDVGPEDTIQLKVTDKGTKMLLVKVGPFKKFGVTCFPEVAQTWSELDGWGGWQVAAPYYLQSLSISQVVIALKDGDKPDKVVAFR